MNTVRLFLSAAFLPLAPLVAAVDPLQIRDGDRVLFIGDTLIEREGTYGYLETRMHEQFPDRKFIVRNLGFSGDTPLGWSRASFDPPAKGWDRLKEQLALVRPTVAIIGYGMAASLQEITDRSGDATLNPDLTRYGAEPMSPARFKKELAQLMDAITEAGRGGNPEIAQISADSKKNDPASPVSAESVDRPQMRFVLLSPIRHEDLRPTKPGLPDPAVHNKLLEQYSKAIEGLAKERGARFIDLSSITATKSSRTSLTDNGIHLRERGFAIMADEVRDKLGWASPVAATPRAERDPRREALRTAVIKKNELFFYRWRPANSTYLFGFRKQEQGQNAVEIPKFDPLIEQAEAEIDRLKKGGAANVGRSDQKGTAASDASSQVKALPATITPARPAPNSGDLQVTAEPQFAVTEGYQIALWAQNPLLEKPTQMNWDAAGRLWICSSSLYPMIAPGEIADDKILVLEDTDHDGRADKSTVFAGGLLVPTGVEPDVVPAADRKAPGKESEIRQRPFVDACYVGQSTELLRLQDTDGDGKADEKRIVLSGFGTEDTHHIIHALHWGPDGRLYFNQSVYIHSHLETPYGMVRLNSGGIFAYDPRTERVEVFARGWWNSWGHQMDKWGQSFATDGAGSTGISWVIPGAVFPAYEGSRRIAPAISPGSYPKFCGLELIYSPHFPSDWQGNAITCDFRAHRVVRFQINDLSETASSGNPQSATSGEPASGRSAGYAAKEMPDFIRTSDISFRPIDVKLGPDGALYIADWSNPVINHGEVDFRDPRRDKHSGRIWRVTKKDAPLVKWEPLANKKFDELLKSVDSANLWEKEQTRRVMESHEGGRLTTALEKWVQTRDVSALTKLAADPNLRVRLEAIRALAKIPTARSAEVVLDAYLPPEEGGANVRRTSSLPSSRATSKADRSKDTPNPPPSPGQTESLPHIADPFLDYAAWLSINELAKPWTEAVASGAWKIGGRETQLVWGLTAIDPGLAGQTLSRLGDKIEFPKEGGPWIEIIGKAGGPKELRKLFAMVAAPDHLNASATVRALDALGEAARVRGARPDAAAQTTREPLLNPDYQTIARLLASSDRELQGAAARLAGFWKVEQAADALAPLAASADAALRASAMGALREIGGQTALSFLGTLVRPDQPLDVRRAALVTIAQIKLDGAIFYAPDVLGAIRDEAAALETWRALLQIKGAANSFAIKIKQAGAGVFPKPVATAGLRAAREIGKNGEALVAALGTITGGTTIAGPATQDFQAMVEVTKRDGDPARGELIYRRANLGCVTCHAIGGAGGKVGPELTSLGASAPLDYVIESVLAPAAKVKEGFNGVTYTLNDGSVISGIQARDTGQEIFVRDVTGREQSIVKANIAGKQNIGSIMPAGLVEQLPRREQLDLFSFLGELGKPGVYDASKGQVARVWTLYPGADGDGVLRGELKSENSANAFTLVDGRLLKEQLVDAVQLLTNAGDVVYAAAQFQTAAAGKTRLNLSGATQAWLDGKPLVIEPTAAPELAAGSHQITVKLDVKRLPDALRAETTDGRFIGN